MARTAQLGLPLVAPAQAQKHVTVNEALARLDAATQLRVLSSTVAEPPVSVVEGSVYIVPTGAIREWQDKSAKLAAYNNGGWLFITPKAGWRAWDSSQSAYLIYDGSQWRPNVAAVSPSGAATLVTVIEIDHSVAAGQTNLLSGAIPARSLVFGVTGRVVAAVSGAGLKSWRVGVPGFDNRYGTSLGIALNSSLVGLSGTPLTYYDATPLLLSGEGGGFASGRIKIAVHLMQLVPPGVV